jgi:PKD domain/Kazal-type serine protease inhibitor domain
MFRATLLSLIYLVIYIVPLPARADEQDYAGQEKMLPDSQRGMAPYAATFTIQKDPTFTYRLSFGDGTREGTLVCAGNPVCSLVKIKHAYEKPGAYPVELYRLSEDSDGKISDKSLRGLAAQALVQVNDPKPAKPEPLCKRWFNGCVECERAVQGGVMSCPKKQCVGALLPTKCVAEFYINKIPTVSISGPATVEEGILREWKVAATDPEGERMVYAVRWGDESAEEQKKKLAQSPLTKFTHTYELPGIFTITVYAKDSSGGVAKNTTTVRVRDAYANVACTREYVPVCGDKDGELKTYSNDCSLHKARAKKKKDGAC